MKTIVKLLLLIILLLGFIVPLYSSCSYIDSNGNTQFMDEGGVVADMNGQLHTCSGGNFTTNGAASNLHQMRKRFQGTGMRIRVPQIGHNGEIKGWLVYPAYKEEGPLIATPYIPNYKINYRQALNNPDNLHNQIKISVAEDYSEPWATYGIYHSGTNMFLNEGDQFDINSDYPGLVYYQVRETDIYGTANNPWSPMMVTTPNLKPDYVSATDFSWEPIPNAATYNLTIYHPNPSNCEQYQYNCYRKWEFLPHFEEYRVGHTIEGIEETSITINSLMPEQTYYYNIQAIDQLGQVIPANESNDATFYTYDSDAYVMIDGKPNESYSYFYTGIPTGGPNQGQRVYMRETGGGSEQYTELSWKEIPGAAKYDIQFAIGVPIPATAPFIDGYQYNGVLGDNSNYPTFTKVLSEVSNVDDVHLNANDDLDSAKPGFQFRFPSFLDDYFNLASGFVKLRIYYKVRAYDYDGNLISAPTIGTQKIVSDAISFDYQSRTIYWESLENTSYDIIDISNDPEHFTKLPLLNRRRVVATETTETNDHLRTDASEQLYVRRYVSKNSASEAEIAAQLFAEKLRKSRIGIDYNLLKLGLTHEVCQDAGYKDLFDYIHQTYAEDEITFPLLQELNVNEVSVEANQIILDNYIQDELIDLSSGSCSIEIVRNDNFTKLIFHQNGEGRFGIKLAGANGAYFKLFNDIVPHLQTKKAFTFHDLLPNETYYYRRIALVNGRWTNWSSTHSFTISEIPFPYIDRGLTEDIVIWDSSEEQVNEDQNFQQPNPESLAATGKAISEELQVFPNPTDGRFTVRMPKSLNHDTPIHILNSVGKIVCSTKLQVGEYSKTINLSGIPAGLYWLQISPKDGPKYIRKVMIQQP